MVGSPEKKLDKPINLQKAIKWGYIGAYTFCHVLCLICVEYLCPFFEGQKKVHCGVLWRDSLYTLRVKGDTKARNSNSKIPQVSFNAARPSFTARICSLLVVSFTPIITSLTLAVGRILACYANGGATKNMSTEKDFGDLLGKI